MTDKLGIVGRILSEQAFSSYRLRMIGSTKTAALELRGLSDADMEALSTTEPVGTKATVVVQEEPAPVPVHESMMHKIFNPNTQK